MPRFNTFFLIHNGLKAMLDDVYTSLQQKDFASAAAGDAVVKLGHLLNFFDGHARQEDKFIFSLLERHDPGLRAEIEREHETETLLNKELRTLIHTFKTAAGTEKDETGRKIIIAFDAYKAFNIAHMEKENTVVRDCLWVHYSDVRLAGAIYQLIRSLSFRELRTNVSWIMRGNSIADVVKWTGAATIDSFSLFWKWMFRLPYDAKSTSV